MTNPDEQRDEGPPIVHLSLGPGGHLEDLHNQVDGRILRSGAGGWDTCLSQSVAESSPGVVRHGATLIELDFHRERRSLTTTLLPGEARSLAAALIHMANVAEGVR